MSEIEIDLHLKNAVKRMVDLAVSGLKSYGILKKERLGGALVYGPPGTGKTHLARVLAKESNAAMLHVSAAEIEGTYVGDTEKLIKALFNLGKMLSRALFSLTKLKPCSVPVEETPAVMRGVEWHNC